MDAGDDSDADDTPSTGGWTLAELVDRCGGTVSERTVRFWITEGLLAAPSGGRGVHARYGRAHVERIAEIRRLQALGLSLANIALLLDEGGGSRSSSSRPPFWGWRPQTGQEVALAPGLRLVLDTGPPLDAHHIEALRRAAAPLVAVYATVTAPAPLATHRPQRLDRTDHLDQEGPHHAP